MGINEIDLTIYPYTVGREDCTILPRSFKTLTEAQTYLAKQEKADEFYLDGPEPDNAASTSCGTPASDPRVIAPLPVVEHGETTSECKSTVVGSRATPGAWKREIEELCRALEVAEGAQ